jgi:hypothetical protein
MVLNMILVRRMVIQAKTCRYVTTIMQALAITWIKIRLKLLFVKPNLTNTNEKIATTAKKFFINYN